MLLNTVALCVMFTTLFALCLAAVFRAVCTPGMREGKAKCGHCGYAIVEVGSGVCPECGGRFTDIGLLTQRCMLRTRGSYTGLLLGWTALLVTSAFWGFALVGPNSLFARAIGIPVVVRNTNSTEYGPMQDFDYSTGRFVEKQEFRFIVEADYLEGSNGFLVGTTTVAINPNASLDRSHARIDHETLELSIVNSSGRQTVVTGEFDEAAAAEFIRRAILEFDEAQLVTIARSLSILVSEIRKEGPSRIESMDSITINGQKVLQSWISSQGNGLEAPMFSRTYGITPPGYIYGSAGITLLVIYVVFLIGLARRRHRLLAAMPPNA